MRFKKEDVPDIFESLVLSLEDIDETCVVKCTLKKKITATSIEESLEELRLNDGHTVEFQMDFWISGYKEDVWVVSGGKNAGEKRKRDEKTDAQYWSFIYIEDLAGGKYKVHLN